MEEDSELTEILAVVQVTILHSSCIFLGDCALSLSCPPCHCLDGQRLAFIFDLL